MAKKMIAIMFLFTILLHSTITHAEKFKYIEIFDPKQNKVVKVVQLNKKIHNIVANWIKNIDDIYGKNDPITDDGYGIKIPLDSTVRIHTKYINLLVNQVYIIIPKNDPPFFMVFENENKVYCFLFKGDIDVLSKILDFNLRN